jgi:predicted benzoate:H+ symporter BenE
MKLFKDILTEDDNNTYCAARVCGVAALFGFLGIALVHTFHNNPIDFSQLGMGFGAVLGGSGVMIGAKAMTQKDDNVPPTN